MEGRTLLWYKAENFSVRLDNTLCRLLPCSYLTKSIPGVIGGFVRQLVLDKFYLRFYLRDGFCSCTLVWKYQTLSSQISTQLAPALPFITFLDKRSVHATWKE